MSLIPVYQDTCRKAFPDPGTFYSSSLLKYVNYVTKSMLKCIYSSSTKGCSISYLFFVVVVFLEIAFKEIVFALVQT